MFYIDHRGFVFRPQRSLLMTTDYTDLHIFLLAQIYNQSQWLLICDNLCNLWSIITGDNLWSQLQVVNGFTVR